MDLNILPLVRSQGQDQFDLPGLYAAVPPRRVARGRQMDRLILYLTLEGNAPLSAENQRQLFQRLAQTYYKTPGSVTAAMRNLIESLNQYLLERNLRLASSGQQSLGLFTVITVRQGRLYLGLCGPLQAFLINAEGVQQFYDPQPTRRGLGLGRVAPIHYAQASLNPNDTLLLSPQPPSSWDQATLSGLYGQGPQALRRRLLAQVGAELNAVLIQATSGPGKTYTLRPKSQPPLAEQPAAPASEIGSPAVPESLPASAEAVAADLKTVSPLPGEKPAATSASPLPQETAPAVASQIPPSLTVEPSTLPSVRRGRRRSALLQSALTTLSGAFGAFGQALGRALGTLLRRMLPDESILALPTSAMAFTAIVVPLIIVSLASVIYFQRGRTGQYQAYYAQAMQAVQQAEAETDPLLLAEKWQSVLGWLDRAEAYRVTAETQDLRHRAQQALDGLELAFRLDLQPAIVGGLPSSVRITRMVVTESDLFLLDAEQGGVLRTTFTGRGYELDKQFQCVPGGSEAPSTNPVVDILPFPKRDGSGTILMGLRGDGSLLKCEPGAAALEEGIAPPPSGWKGPRAFTYYLGNTYVLDPEANAVWIYRNSDFTQQPRLFFNQQIPPMQDVIDLAVNQDDLYLLHQDGHVTLCTFSELEVVSTTCTEPIPYIDRRPGREGQFLIPASPFIEIYATLPPDPSLYFLEPASQTLYHFSLRLAYQRQLRPLKPFTPRTSNQPASATAFALSPDNRMAYLAFGNEVLYAGMP